MNACLRANSEILFKTVRKQTYILEPEKGLLRTLNTTASFLWNELQQDSSLQKLIEKTATAFHCEKKTVENDVRDFIQQYIKKGYIIVINT